MNMLILVLGTIAAGIATEYFFGNRWIGFVCAGIPLSAFYIYREYQLQKKEEERRKNKHKNKYR